MVGDKGKEDKSKNDKDKITSNRGNTYFSDDSCATDVCPNKSLNYVKNDLMTVIELMGPSTPHFKLYNTSSDADNDELLFSGPIKNVKEKLNKDQFEPASFADSDNTIRSVVSIQQDTDFSLMADKATTGTISYENDFMDCPTCPPPIIPCHICVPPQCSCNQMYGYMHQNTQNIPKYINPFYLNNLGQVITSIGINIQSLLSDFVDINKQQKITKFNEKTRALQEWLKRTALGKQFSNAGRGDYYKINVKQSKFDQCPPKRLVFDLVNDVPKTKQMHFTTQVFDDAPRQKLKHEHKQVQDRVEYNGEKKYFNRNSEGDNGLDVNNSGEIDCCGNINRKPSSFNNNDSTRVDVYYFDHGNSTYLRTTDRPPVVTTEVFAEKTESTTTKFWAEIFGTFHIGFSFCTSFILQLFRFILYSIIRPLTIGLVQLASDYFFKPCLATFFNAVIQPPLIFAYNIATSVRDLCDPVAEAVGYFLREIAVVIRAFRILDIKTDKKCCCEPPKKCEKPKCKTNCADN